FLAFEEHGYAAGQLRDNLVLAAEHGLQIERYARRLYTVRGHGRFRLVVQMARLEQRFAWNATNPQARSAEDIVVVNTCGIQSQLCGSDGSYVTARASANYHHVMFGLLHRIGPASCIRGRITLSRATSI